MSPTTAHWLYAVFALGGIALYCLIPQRQPKPLVSIGLGLCAIASWVLVMALRVVSPGANSAYFLLFAALAIVAAVRVITHTKPVYSALYFVLVVIAVAALLVLLQAEFLAAAVVIIYGGAILVTYLFVIMLAQQSGAPAYDRAAREPFWAVVAGFVFMAAVTGSAGRVPAAAAAKTVPVAAQGTIQAPVAQEGGNTSLVGSALMTKFVVGVELAGLLLLISMIGAIALARKRVPTESVSVPIELGRAGREVKPF